MSVSKECAECCMSVSEFQQKRATRSCRDVMLSGRTVAVSTISSDSELADPGSRRPKDSSGVSKPMVVSEPSEDVDAEGENAEGDLCGEDGSAHCTLTSTSNELTQVVKKVMSLPTRSLRRLWLPV